MEGYSFTTQNNTDTLARHVRADDGNVNHMNNGFAAAPSHYDDEIISIISTNLNDLYETANRTDYCNNLNSQHNGHTFAVSGQNANHIQHNTNAGRISGGVQMQTTASNLSTSHIGEMRRNIARSNNLRTTETVTSGQYENIITPFQFISTLPLNATNDSLIRNVPQMRANDINQRELNLLFGRQQTTTKDESFKNNLNDCWDDALSIINTSQQTKPAIGHTPEDKCAGDTATNTHIKTQRPAYQQNIVREKHRIAASCNNNTSQANVHILNEVGPSGSQARAQPIQKRLDSANVNLSNNFQLFTPNQMNERPHEGVSNDIHQYLMNIAAPSNIDRPPAVKRKSTIDIKVIRASKQYEILREMGFGKVKVERTLRLKNMDLDETIEHLGQPAKRRKKDAHDNSQPIWSHPQENANVAVAPALMKNSAAVDNLICISDDEATANQCKIEPEPVNLYEELLRMDDLHGAIVSNEPFDCEICTETIDRDGIVLRDCLHRFCKDCIKNTIIYNENIEINCPCTDCDGCIQDREIRAVISNDEYDKYLLKGLRVAQSTISGTILCNEPDCNGWCICEDDVNEFKCPQCRKMNCVPCKAIHSGRNCREYQEDLAAGDASGIGRVDRRTEDSIKSLIMKGEAIRCPQCGILIMKREGCDWLKCSMCKVEICWATRGPRWGPMGFGDISAGCRCGGMMGMRCTPGCRGCH